MTVHIKAFAILFINCFNKYILLLVPPVLIICPTMELHWKKKKKIPKNFTTTDSGSIPSSTASLKIKYNTKPSSTSTANLKTKI